MRIEQLDLIAFGAFEDRSIDLRGDQLQLVVGANEAGKTTLLRAIEALLFGFPERLGDAHLFGATKLRVGASITGDSGNSLELRRRKGRTATLLGPDDQPLESDPLAPLLGGTGAELFRQRFLLNQSELFEGAEELLGDGGDVAKSIFAASLGGMPIGEQLAEMQQQAAELFLPGGKKPLINALAAEYKAAVKARNEKLLDGAELERLTDAVAASELASERAEQALREAEQQLAVVQRRQGIVSAVTERGRAVRELEQAEEPDEQLLAATPAVEELCESHGKLAAAAAAHNEQLVELELLLASQREQFGQLDVPRDLSELAAAADALRDRGDLAGQVAELRELELRLQALAELGDVPSSEQINSARSERGDRLGALLGDPTSESALVELRKATEHADQLADVAIAAAERTATQRELESRKGAAEAALAVTAEATQRVQAALGSDFDLQPDATLRAADAALKLNDQLAAKRATAQAQIEQREQELAAKRPTVEAAQSAVAEWQQQWNILFAGLSLPETTTVAHARAALNDHAARRTVIAELERTVRQAEAQIAEAGEDAGKGTKLDPAELQATADATQREIERLRSEERKAIEELTQARSELAAEAAENSTGEQQEPELIAAELSELSDSFVALTARRVLLESTVELYRQQTQGPVLARASDLFRELTLESFSGVKAEPGGDGNVVLRAYRAQDSSGTSTPLIANQLSEGTRDQLYLALRIATLERALEAGPQLPVVLDDVTVNFDDDRAQATFAALSRLLELTQVIFLTHHDHLVPLAEAALGADQVAVRSINAPHFSTNVAQPLARATSTDVR